MTLQIDDLGALARSFAEDEAAWAPQVRHDASRRIFHKLLDGDEATVWADLLDARPRHRPMPT